jgi:hypothetical protein
MPYRNSSLAYSDVSQSSIHVALKHLHNKQGFLLDGIQNENNQRELKRGTHRGRSVSSRR